MLVDDAARCLPPSEISDPASSNDAGPVSLSGAEDIGSPGRRIRHTETRAATIRALRVVEDEFPGDGAEPLPARPARRGECAEGQRPCPWVSCRHHLFLDVQPRTGHLHFNFPELSGPEEMTTDSCSLDVADNGGETLEAVGTRLQVTRERVRQIEILAGRKAFNVASIFLTGIAPERTNLARRDLDGPYRTVFPSVASKRRA